jgi:dTDP-4-amino-4,6-dideoxy-D-glucose acyltransferase
MKNNNLKLLQQVSSHGSDIFISKNVEIKYPELIELGSHIAIDSGFKCTVKMKLGDYIHIAPDVVVIGGRQGYLELGDFAGIAAGSKIVCGSENYVEGGLIGPTIPAKFRNLIIKPVIFGRFVVVGVNCCVMPGIILGEGSVVGANSVVTKNTVPWTVYIGSPAKPVRIRDKETVLKYAKELGY